MRWLVVSRGFFDAFPEGLPEADIRDAIRKIGYGELREVAPRLAPYLASIAENGAQGEPAISSACPPANAWLARNDPGLAARLVDILSPAEEALLDAAREAATEAQDLRPDAARPVLHFVSPCHAKKEAMRSFAAGLIARPGFAGLDFAFVDLRPLRAEILAKLGLDTDLAPGEERPPVLPPEVLFVEGEKGLEELSRRGTPAATRAILPFWCEGGCNGSAFKDNDKACRAAGPAFQDNDQTRRAAGSAFKDNDKACRAAGPAVILEGAHG